MPTLSLFYGIAIQMYLNDHDPPHFHVRYAEFKGRYTLDPLARMSGDIPANAERMVLLWTQQHKAELAISW